MGKRSRRLVKFNVTPDILLFMGSGKFEVVANPLPADVALVGAFYDTTRHTFSVVVHSKTFAQLKEGDSIPDVPAPQIKRLDR